MIRRVTLVGFIFMFTWLYQLFASPADEQKLELGDNNFGFTLLKQLAKNQPAANIFISPYSAATVLKMVGNGAAGETKAEMDEVLGTKGLSANTVNAANKAIAVSLNKFNTDVILTMANAIWYMRGETVKPDFLALNRQFFGSTIGPIDFAEPHSVDAINAWANEKTHGRISRIADGMIDPVYTKLFLANAVYFKGKWSDPFKPKNTKDRPFHVRGGGEKVIPMMTRSKTFTYQQGAGYQAVRLPYVGENLAMYIFLPETNSSPEQLLGIMNGDGWQRVTKPGFTEKEGLLVLPKFKLEYSVELKQPLQALGMKRAFEMGQADFSGIAPQLYISAARQRTFIEVNEEGTEAAATSAVGIQVLGIKEPPLNPFKMIVDRPFLFLIEDSQTGTILFMGLIFDPHSD